MYCYLEVVVISNRRKKALIALKKEIGLFRITLGNYRETQTMVTNEQKVDARS